MPRRSLVLAGALLLAGCFPDHVTPLPSCERAGGAPTSSGTLTVLASDVPGIVVDSATWNSRTTSPDMSVVTGLVYEAHVSSTVKVPIDSIGVEFRSDRAADDSALFVEGWLMSKTNEFGNGEIQMAEDTLRPGQPRYALTMLSQSGRKPGPWGCPRSVRIVRRARP